MDQSEVQPKKASPSESSNLKGKTGDQQYERRVSRISKENAFMVLAVWMEQSPRAKATADNRQIVGAVLVTEENRLYAMDCTRDGVHAVVRLLMKHSQKLKNSTIYTSRRPCSFCAKLLVQCGISHLYYLPTEPENKDDDDLHRVDNLLKVARLGHSYFIPNVDEKVAQKSEENVKEIERSDTPMIVNELKEGLMRLYWKQEWMDQAADKLHWTAWDEKTRPQFKADFESVMKWISQVTVAAMQIHGFIRWLPPSVPPSKVANGGLDEPLYRHLLAMANILAQRTDDPKTGVGAVIWKDEQIVATAWNGFPAKALYGEFPRASDKDEAAPQKQKKYPYVIHAEQNALLMKNTEDISGSILFVTKVPCNECVPLLMMEKVTTCVIGITKQKAEEEEFKRDSISYNEFPKEVKNGFFTCFFELKESRPPADTKASAARNLKYPNQAEGADKRSADKREQDPSNEQSGPSSKIQKQ